MKIDVFDRLRAGLVRVLPSVYRTGAMPWVFFVGMLLTSSLIGLSILEYRNYGDYALLTFALFTLMLILAVQRGLSFKIALHCAMAVALLAQWYAAWNSGGIYSPRLVSVVLIPLTPFFFFGLRSGLFWLALVLLSVFGLAVFTALGWVDMSLVSDLRHVDNSWGTFSLLVAFVLVVPMAYNRMNERVLMEQHQRRAELERQRAELERTQAVRDRFIASVSHELRTPMNAILGLNAWLLASVKDAPEAVHVLNHTRQSADHLMTVINDVLDYSQLQSGTLHLHPQVVDLHASVRTAVDMLAPKARGQGLVFECDIHPDVPQWVGTDRHRLTQVLVNLLGNAIKFTSEGSVTLRLSRSGQRVRFDVTDTGIGIPPEHHDRLFQRFSQADASISQRYGGNGLGLAISRSLVALLGGSLDFSSEEGKGSNFYFSLDLPEQSAPQLDHLSDKKPLQTASRAWCFLVVDDHPVNRLLVHRVLLQNWPQAHIMEAADGLEALAAVQAHAVDAVFMDMRMPVMDGIDATQAIRRLPSAAAQTLVLGLTANVNQDDLTRFEAAGLDGLMLKPFDWRELCMLVEGLLLQRESTHG